MRLRIISWKFKMCQIWKICQLNCDGTNLTVGIPWYLYWDGGVRYKYHTHVLWIAENWILVYFLGDGIGCKLNMWTGWITVRYIVEYLRYYRTAPYSALWILPMQWMTTRRKWILAKPVMWKVFYVFLLAPWLGYSGTTKEFFSPRKHVDIFTEHEKIHIN